MSNISEGKERLKWYQLKRVSRVFGIHIKYFLPMSILVIAALMMDSLQYFFEHTKTTAEIMEKHWHDFNGINFDMCAKVKEGRLPLVYCECEDPKREIPVFLSDDTLQIIVGGDPARAQSKGFMQSGYIGLPVSKKVELPENWTKLIR